MQAVARPRLESSLGSAPQSTDLEGEQAMQSWSRALRRSSRPGEDCMGEIRHKEVPQLAEASGAEVPAFSKASLRRYSSSAIL